MKYKAVNTDTSHRLAPVGKLYLFTMVKHNKMVRLIFESFLFILISCQSDNFNPKELFEGNWSYCQDDGIYVELHVRKNIIEWCPEIEPYGVLYKYKIRNDSLFIAFPSFEKGTLKKGQIEIINNDNIVINFQNNGQNERYSLSRINSKIGTVYSYKNGNNENTISKKQYLKEYYERMKNKSCKIKKLRFQKNLKE